MKLLTERQNLSRPLCLGFWSDSIPHEIVTRSAKGDHVDMLEWRRLKSDRWTGIEAPPFGVYLLDVILIAIENGNALIFTVKTSNDSRTFHRLVSYFVKGHEQLCPYRQGLCLLYHGCRSNHQRCRAVDANITGMWIAY